MNKLRCLPRVRHGRGRNCWVGSFGAKSVTGLHHQLLGQDRRRRGGLCVGDCWPSLSAGGSRASSRVDKPWGGRGPRKASELSSSQRNRAFELSLQVLAFEFSISLQRRPQEFLMIASPELGICLSKAASCHRLVIDRSFW